MATSLFENILEKNISERQSALFEIERILFTKRYNLSRKHIDILSVQSISMIYSIWEGFIQTAFNAYIDEINNQEINPQIVKEELYVYHIENTFKQFREYPEKHKRKIYFFNKLNQFFQNDKFELQRGVNTQSNVSFEVLNNILISFCLAPFPEHWKNYAYPNPNLQETLLTFLRYRNGVSHGGDISSEEKITQVVFEKYKKLVIDLMYQYSGKNLSR